MNSQRKGMDGEREIVEIYRAHGFRAERNGCYEKDDVTVWLHQDQSETKTVEVKRAERLSAKQLNEELKGRDEVVHRGNCQDWMVTRRLKDDLHLQMLAGLCSLPDGEAA